MNWTDEAIILSLKPHGETAAVAEVFARGHGRYLGLIHGGQSRRFKPFLQPGNHVHVSWKARLADQLGHFTVEEGRSYAAQALDNAAALAGLSALTALLRALPERDPHPNLYEITLFVLGFLDDPTVWPALYARWELAFLDEMGFGLDLSACASTGANDGLIYVSPKSGRAVSASAGEPYRDKLLPLPAFFLKGRHAAVGTSDVLDALKLTGHFIAARIYAADGRTVPEARARLVEILGRHPAEPTANAGQRSSSSRR